ncbi:MAG: FadR family transcriptional regulator [Chloroflexi bacterium]|nr:FadR family transcriptional regulator [Chloroflexota bacterium]
MTEKAAFPTVNNKERLVDRVVKEVEDRIISGELPPGAKLPPEREWAEQMGVSRTVIREAARILAAKGLLLTQHGVGTTVRKLTSQHVVEPLGLYLRSQNHGLISFDDLHQVRSILEIEIAGIAAKSATAEEIAHLRQVFESMVEAKDDVSLLAERDTEFHRTLAMMTHNPLLFVLIDSIRQLLQEYIALVTVFLDPDEDNIPLHRLLLERIEARDEAGARQAMQKNLEQMQKNTELYSRRTAQTKDVQV